MTKNIIEEKTEKHTKEEVHVLWFSPLYPSLPGVCSMVTLQFVLLHWWDFLSPGRPIFSYVWRQFTILWKRGKRKLQITILILLYHRKMRPSPILFSVFGTLFLLWTFPAVCCDSGGAGWESSLISRVGGGRGGDGRWEESSWLLKVSSWCESRSSLQLWSENNEDEIKDKPVWSRRVCMFLISAQTREKANL